MENITVIGLGDMGSALVRVLLDAGSHVTVWNRTAAKAAALVELGAELADNPAAAVAASDVILVCVSSCQDVLSILTAPDVADILSGRKLLNLTTGSPKEARDCQQVFSLIGAFYLDGAIIAYPDQIGTADATILVSGPQSVFNEVEIIVSSLGSTVMYLGEVIGSSSALDCAILSFVNSAIIGFVHGAHICEVEGLSVDMFGKVAKDVAVLIGAKSQSYGDVIHKNEFEHTQATLAVWSRANDRIVSQARDAGIDDSFPVYAYSLYQRGLNAGLGDLDVSALIKVLRNESQRQQ